MNREKFRKPKRKCSNPTWPCELCDFISPSKKGIELHLKITHRMKNYKIKNPLKEELKELKANVQEGYCVLCCKSMSLHSKNNGNCP